MTKLLGVFILLAVLLVMTRGSHALTAFSLPDASLVIFLLGGIYLRQWGYFLLLFALAAGTDVLAAQSNSLYAFCLTAGYWGLLPTYGLMWLAGYGLKNTASAIRFWLTVTGATLLAFIVSTQSYYLFSGRFSSTNLFETLQYGWQYLPSYLISTLAYCLVYSIAIYCYKNFYLPIQTSWR